MWTMNDGFKNGLFILLLTFLTESDVFGRSEDMFERRVKKWTKSTTFTDAFSSHDSVTSLSLYATAQN